MLNTIQGRILMGYLLFIALLITGLGMTYFATEGQKDDSLVVNLAGRQRMLTQKMTKETLVFVNKADSQDVAELGKWASQIKSTMRVFESTLFALRDGGPAPINLEMTQFRQTPSAGTSEINDQLTKVSNLWKTFKVNVSAILDSQGKDAKALEYIISNNTHLLKEMNSAVFMMQVVSEQKVNHLISLQGAVVVAGLLLVVLGSIIVKFSIVDPIVRLIKAAEDITKGNIKDEIHEKGTREIENLGASFNRMRISLQKMMERYAKTSV